jgi:flagellar P-ring protein precursor FlgI
MKTLPCILLLAALTAAGTTPARIKDLTSIEGVRNNPLVGYGLVVGLNGTGDRRQTLFSTQTLANLLQQMGTTVPASQIRVQDIAAVLVTGELPPFARPGTRIDLTVAAVGDATSLQGGVLVMTSLHGVNGVAYALGQGPLVLGGFAAGGGANSRTVNHPTTGRIPSGGIVEVPAPPAALEGTLRLQLRNADFATASRIAAAVNRKLASQNVARAENSASVAVAIPAAMAGRAADFIAEICDIPVEADMPAKVVINERTGTVVLGQKVLIAPVTIVHGTLTVEVQTVYDVSQPQPFTQGTPQVLPQTSVRAKESQANNIVLREGATVEDLVRSLAAIGATARDVVAILQNLRSAGALQAELEVI